MANKKKPYLVFETKEDFDKWLDDHLNKISKEQRAMGFEDGSIWVLSYIEELLQDMFKPEAFAEAQREMRHRQIEEWRKDHNRSTLKNELDKRYEIKKMVKEFEKDVEES